MLAFHYVPKTIGQVRLVGWAILPAGLFVTVLGLLFTAAALVGAVE